MAVFPKQIQHHPKGSISDEYPECTTMAHMIFIIKHVHFQNVINTEVFKQKWNEYFNS